MTYEQWLSEGIARGWILPPVCDTHDGGHVLEEEMEAFDRGEDPCIVVLRVLP